MAVVAPSEQIAAPLRARSLALQFWWSHLRAPLLAFIPLAMLFATTDLDRAVARTFFYRAASLAGTHGGWLGGGIWWVNEIVHEGGERLVRGIGILTLALCGASFVVPKLRPLRRPVAFMALAMGLSVGTVALLKVLTNVHCPWGLTDFGGRMPYLHLFDPRPEAMAPGHCFPAAHASAGYSLLVLYFVFRDRNDLLSRLGLAAGICAGVLFGLAQQARGAHFVSHDLWSAFLVWTITLTVYAFAFQARLWRRDE